MFNVLEISYDVLLGDKIAYYHKYIQMVVMPFLVNMFVEKCLTKKYTKVY